MTAKRTGPGRYLPTGDTLCGYDGGSDDVPICGKTATWHLLAGSPEVGPGDYSMTACDDHANRAMELAYDWHEFGGVCDMPGTKWQSRNRQGEGFCYWPEAEAASQEQVNQVEVTA